MQFLTTYLVILALSVLSVVASPVALASPKIPTRSVSYGGKRGALYDYTSSDYSKYFVGSNKVAFGSDYHATRGETGATLDQQFGFIPTLRSDDNLQNPTWIATIKDFIANGGKIVFAYVAF